MLEKYDNKLDELQEDLEMRDLKIIEYERDLDLPSGERIKIESIEDKIKFITSMLDRLREMHNTQKQEEARERKMQVNKKREKITSIERRKDGKVNEDRDDKSPRKPIIDQSITESIDKLTNEIMVQIQGIERQAKAH